MSSVLPIGRRHAAGAAAVVLLLILGVIVAAGGYKGAPLPNLAIPAAPAGFHQDSFPRGGVEMSVPTSWLPSAAKAPLIGVVSSGPAVIALWRYPYSSPPPTGAAQLAQTRAALLASIARRDRTFKLLASAVLAVDGAGAVELDALETINGQRRRVRSEHIYVSGAEVVLDEYAPVAIFPAVDHLVFSPVRKSLRLLHAGAAG